jgi:hypothetical protein
MSGLTDAQGNPIATEAKLRAIKINEKTKDGKRFWSVDYDPDISEFEFEEVFQVLGNVVAGIAQSARARKREAIIQQEMQAKLASIKGE